MTATLRIRLEKFLLGAGTVDGLVADVIALDAAGHRDHARDKRDLIIPAGPGVPPLPVVVDPGQYVVQATLPSGDVTTDQVTVAEGDDTEVTLQGPHSPNEWLSWQQFIGNVPSVPDFEPTKPIRRARSRKPTSHLERIAAYADDATRESGAHPWVSREAGIRFKVNGFKTAKRPSPSRRAPGRGTGRGRCSASKPESPRPPVARARPWPTIWFVRQPVPELSGDGPGGGAWATLSGKHASDEPLAAVAAGAAVKAQPQFEQEAWRRYSFGGDGDLPFGRNETAGGDQLPRRYVVSIRSRGAVEIACLPVPWDAGRYGQVAVDLLVRHEPLPGEAVLALSPDDDGLRSALGYMGNGDLANARLMFDRAKDLLFGKMINPLSGAAGGYMLLATEQGEAAQDWHQWIENLANWFHWLPDGMILLGRLRLLRRKGPADVQAARAAFFSAYDRGIPFYSLGLQWLVDGLSLLASADDAEARERLSEVQEVTWRANLQQPFTTIRLRDR